MPGSGRAVYNRMMGKPGLAGRRRAGLGPGEGADALRQPGLLAGGVLHRAAGPARHHPGAFYTDDFRTFITCLLDNMTTCAMASQRARVTNKAAYCSL